VSETVTIEADEEIIKQIGIAAVDRAENIIHGDEFDTDEVTELGDIGMALRDYTEGFTTKQAVSTERNSLMSDSKWSFDVGSVAREEHTRTDPMGEPLNPKEYKVRRRLVDPDTGDRFYHVEKEQGGTHVYTENVLDLRYEEVSVEESTVWPKDE